MTRAESYTKKVEDWLTPVLSPMGFELVDVEYVKEAGTWYLRVYIDKEGGITVDDCETVSRRMDTWLDEEDFESGATAEKGETVDIFEPGMENLFDTCRIIIDAILAGEF